MRFACRTAQHIDFPESGPARRPIELDDGRMLVLRAATPRDTAAVQRFIAQLSAESRRNRFHAPMRELSPELLERIMRTRLPAELALVAETAEGAASRIVALAQYVMREKLEAEVAVVVDDAWHRRGLATHMIGALTKHALATGLTALTGEVLVDNWPMRALLGRLDCEIVGSHDPYVIAFVKRLVEPSPARSIVQ